MKGLRWNPDGADSSNITWDELGEVDDGEFVLRFTLSENPTTDTRCWFRFRDSSAGWYAFLLQGAVSDALTFRFFRHIAPSGFSTLTTVDYFSLQDSISSTDGISRPLRGRHWFARVRFQGTTLQFRVWQDGNVEPGSWDSTTTDSNNTNGNIVWSHTLAGQPIITYMSVHKGTGSAPLPTDAPGVNDYVAKIQDSEVGSPVIEGWTSPGTRWIIADQFVDSQVYPEGEFLATVNINCMNIISGNSPLTSPDGNDYSLSKYKSGTFRAIWNRVPVLNDQEILALFEAQGTGTSLVLRYHFQVMFKYDLSTNNRYEVGIHNNGTSPTSVTINRVIDGTRVKLDETTVGWSQGNDYWFRIRTEGSLIRAWFWQYGSPEPSSPTLEATDSTLEEGRIGVATPTNHASNTGTKVHYLSVGMNGFPAPEPI